MTFRLRMSSLALSGLVAVGASLAVASPASAADPTCKVPKDMAKLIPADAQFAADLDVDRLTKTQLWKDTVGELSKDKDFQQVVGVLGTCGIKVADVRHATVGFSENNGDQVVFGLEAPGIGSSSTTSCLATQIGLIDGNKPKFKAVGCATEISFDGDDARAYALDKDHVVLVSDKWSKAMMGQVKGGSTKGVAKDMGKQSSSSHMRFAIEVTPEMRSMMGSSASSLKRLAGSMSFGKKITASLSGEMGSTAEAMQLSLELQGYLAIAKMAADSAGIPPKMLDDIHISNSGSTVTATMSVDYKELKEAAKSAGI